MDGVAHPAVEEVAEQQLGVEDGVAEGNHAEKGAAGAQGLGVVEGDAVPLVYHQISDEQKKRAVQAPGGGKAENVLFQDGLTGQCS